MIGLQFLTRMGKRKLGRKFEGRREWGRPRYRWEDNIGIYLKYMVWVVKSF